LTTYEKYALKKAVSINASFTSASPLKLLLLLPPTPPPPPVRA
jgi:hypothetical protein